MAEPFVQSPESLARFEAAFTAANDQLYRHTSRAEAAFRELLPLLPPDDQPRRARVLERLSITSRIHGNYETAWAEGSESFRLYELNGDDAGMGRTCVSLGNVAWCQGRMTDALAYFETALEIRERLDDPQALVGAVGSVANILSELERYPEARSHYERALALSEQIGDRRFAARTHNNLGECLLLMDETEPALHHCETALKLCKALGDRTDEPNVLINLGRIHTRRLNWQTALDLLDEAAATAVIAEDRRTEAEAMMYRARLTEDRARREPRYARQAEMFREEALAHAEAIGAYSLCRQLHEDCAVAADRAGHKIRAHQHWAKVDEYREMETADRG